jgi:hypothetical protein
VVGKISAGASDARIIRPWGMKADICCRVNKRLAARTVFVLSLSEQIIQRTRAALDQAREFGWHQCLGHLQRIGLVGPLAKVFGAGTRQIYDIAVTQCAGTPVGAEYDDFLWTLSLSLMDAQPA